ncbi:hypothetical protein [Paenibacillus terreus]|uniref:hypothetical protein n=1 Tax=Paenibacillus terreus TaxID=1387834 RepID=UPI0035CD0C8A
MANTERQLRPCQLRSMDPGLFDARCTALELISMLKTWVRQESVTHRQASALRFETVIDPAALRLPSRETR